MFTICFGYPLQRISGLYSSNILLSTFSNGFIFSSSCNLSSFLSNLVWSALMRCWQCQSGIRVSAFEFNHRVNCTPFLLITDFFPDMHSNLNEAVGLLRIIACFSHSLRGTLHIVSTSFLRFGIHCACCMLIRAHQTRAPNRNSVR